MRDLDKETEHAWKEEGHVKTEADIGVRQPQGKGRPGMHAGIARRHVGWGGAPLQPSETAAPADTFTADVWSSEP